MAFSEAWGGELRRRASAELHSAAEVRGRRVAAHDLPRDLPRCRGCWAPMRRSARCCCSCRSRRCRRTRSARASGCGWGAAPAPAASRSRTATCPPAPSASRARATGCASASARTCSRGSSCGTAGELLAARGSMQTDGTPRPRRVRARRHLVRPPRCGAARLARGDGVRAAAAHRRLGAVPQLALSGSVCARRHAERRPPRRRPADRGGQRVRARAGAARAEAQPAAVLVGRAQLRVPGEHSSEETEATQSPVAA